MMLWWGLAVWGVGGGVAAALACPGPICIKNGLMGAWSLQWCIRALCMIACMISRGLGVARSVIPFTCVSQIICYWRELTYYEGGTIEESGLQITSTAEKVWSNTKCFAFSQWVFVRRFFVRVYVTAQPLSWSRLSLLSRVTHRHSKHSPVNVTGTRNTQL